jgi:hypothetical protein
MTTKTPLILTAHQPVYLPWLGLFHKIALADSFVYFDDVQYQDKDWNNRNKIKTAQGPVWLTVPVFNKNHYDIAVKDVLIRNDMPWPRKHFKSIALSYAKAPFVKRYLPFFDDLYKKPWEKLSDLNEEILKYFLKELGIRTAISKLSVLGLQSKKSDLVLEMCGRLGADLYIFGALGKDYANREAFERSGFQVEFQDYAHPVYTQGHGKFISHLSVIDLLMNHGSSSLDILMSGNKTKEQLFKEHFRDARIENSNT